MFDIDNENFHGLNITLLTHYVSISLGGMNKDNFSLHTGRQSWKKDVGNVVDWIPGLQGLLRGDFCSGEWDKHE